MLQEDSKPAIKTFKEIFHLQWSVVNHGRAIGTVRERG